MTEGKIFGHMLIRVGKPMDDAAYRECLDALLEPEQWPKRYYVGGIPALEFKGDPYGILIAKR